MLMSRAHARVTQVHVAMVHASIVLALLATQAPLACAEEQTLNKTTTLEESYGDAFLHYHPYVTPGKKPNRKPELAPATGPRSPANAPEPKVYPDTKQRVDVAWLRKNYPLLEERAINDPSDANVAAQLYVKRVVLDKSQRYSDAVRRVLFEDPLLNENNRVPYASTGAQAVANADYFAQQQAVRELARIGGLIVFVDGACRFCAMQLPVAELVRGAYGLEYLVVSTDGSAPKGYAGRVLHDNGLFKKLGLRLTPSVVFVPRPRGYTDADPNRYLIVSQGFYAADELVKQIAFAGNATELLSKETQAGLAVWNRGIASSADLGALRLDVNDPQDIRATLQPLLMRQYQEGRAEEVQPSNVSNK